MESCITPCPLFRWRLYHISTIRHNQYSSAYNDALVLLLFFVLQNLMQKVSIQRCIWAHCIQFSHCWSHGVEWKPYNCLPLWRHLYCLPQLQQANQPINRRFGQCPKLQHRNHRPIVFQDWIGYIFTACLALYVCWQTVDAEHAVKMSSVVVFSIASSTTTPDVPRDDMNCYYPLSVVLLFAN